MTRLRDQAFLSLPDWAPASVVALDYESALPADRNDIIQFHRLGDINERKYFHAVNAHTSWCLRMIVRSKGDVRFVCNIPSSTRLWEEVRWKHLAANVATEESMIALRFARSVVATRPAESLRLAQAAVTRQARKTSKEIAAWIKQVAEDIKDADD
jgi:hypothetical protein